MPSWNLVASNWSKREPFDINVDRTFKTFNWNMTNVGRCLLLSATVKPLYSGHPWDVANWLLYKGGLIIQCTFQQGSPLWDIIRWLV